MLTVVIPLYNKEATIARALRSVLAQTLQVFEVVVVDDGSTDRSVEQAGNVKDSRIRIIRQANSGVSAARNRGIEEALSDTIAFLDADDEWKPWFAETVSELQRDFPDARVWATRYEFRFPDGTRESARLNGLPTDWRGMLPDYFHLAARSHPPIHSSCVSVSRAGIQSIGGFPVGVRAGEDLLTWARLAAHFPVAYSSKVSSTFWVDRNVESCFSPPSRHPPVEDFVGSELQKLEAIVGEQQKRSLRLYIARWKRMRANMFSRCGDIRQTLDSILDAFRLNPRDPVVWVFVAIAILHASQNMFKEHKPVILT